MKHLWAAFVVFLGACTEPRQFVSDDFKRHIEFLASDEMKGRDNDTEEGRRAGEYVAEQFRSIGLKPAGVGGTWFHEFETKWSPRSEKVIRGRNVAGRVVGTEISQEYIVVGTHHDARGMIGGKIQNGADDAASSVAIVIELARAFARRPARRSIVFVSFDAEEDGMLGSREFVNAKVQDPKDVAAMFVFDCNGGNFTPWEERRVYALGSEYSAELWERTGRLARESNDLDVQRLGVYLIEAFMPRADYGRADYAAYRAAKVPFVFLTTATPWYYHTEHDDLERINYPKMVAQAKFAERLIRETADAPSRPTFIAKPALDFRFEAQTLKEGGEKMLEGYVLKEEQRAQLRRCLDDLEVIAKDPPENAKSKLQRVMTEYFGLVRSQGPSREANR